VTETGGGKWLETTEAEIRITGAHLFQVKVKALFQPLKDQITPERFLAIEIHGELLKLLMEARK